MSVAPLWWIVAGGVLMCALALVGALALVLPDERFERVVGPLVATSSWSPVACTT